MDNKDKKEPDKYVDVGTQVNLDEEELQEIGDRIKLKNVRKLVFGGGFLKGYGLLGCAKYLLEKDVVKNIDTYIGSSVGAFVLMFLVLDYNLEELLELIYTFDFHKFENFTMENILNFNIHFGVDDGMKFVQFIKNAIYFKTKNYYITFKQLYELTGKRFIVTGTNIELRTCEYFSHLTTPDMPVWLAVRISTCFPFFFNKVEYNGINYIDGAASSNCAIEYIEDVLHETIDDTLCVILRSLKDLEYKSTDNENGKEKRGQNLNDDKESYSFYNYLLDVFSSLRYQDIYRLKKYKYNLLEIELHAKMYTEHISREYIDRLLEKGYEVTKLFFTTF
jgi:predicted acylesterase/phospholipase RssA